MMNTTENLVIAFKSIAANKMRAFLTMLGVIVGVMTIVLLVSVITGTKVQIEGDIASLGSNVFMVFPGNYDAAKGPPTTFIINKLRLRHVELLESRSSYGAVACPEYDVMGITLKHRRESRTAAYMAGVSADMLEVYNWQISDGNFFTEADVRAGRRLAVIGKTVVRDLYYGGNPLGKDIVVKGVKFRVVGVLKSEGSMLGYDMDNGLLVPITAAHNLMGASEIHQITLRVPDPADIDNAVIETRRLLSRELDNTEFTVATQGEMLSLFKTFSNVLSIVTGAIAGISLLVGGIGIMNIMLVTVTERTKEIGIRKSVGATFADILSQFMVESTIISVSGGILGTLVSILIILGLSPFVPFPLTASPVSIALALGFSTFIGVFFGTYPAVKAAKTDPIVALRYD